MERKRGRKGRAESKQQDEVAPVDGQQWGGRAAKVERASEGNLRPTWEGATGHSRVASAVVSPLVPGKSGDVQGAQVPPMVRLLG